VIGAWWLSNTLMGWPVSTFQDLAVPSEDPVNNSLSGSLAAMHRMAEP